MWDYQLLLLKFYCDFFLVTHFCYLLSIFAKLKLTYYFDKNL